MDNFQDHDNFFVYLFTFPYFLSIEVGGDEYAGSKLEVPCPFFGTETYIIMTWSVCNGRSPNDSRRERS